jgi:hypothetical protein
LQKINIPVSKAFAMAEAISLDTLYCEIAIEKIHRLYPYAADKDQLSESLLGNR